MINKELVELQKGCIATCVVIQDDDCEELDSKIIIDSKLNDNELMKVFKEKKIEETINYIVIRGIDEINENAQNKYYQIVKDREYKGYKLPKDIIIVLTVKDKESLKNICQELYNFCVIAF